MANIPIPQAGQPIDYNYIYQIVDAVNALSTKLSSKFSESQFDNGTQQETRRLNDMSVVAGYTPINNGAEISVNAGTEVQFSYDFKNNFKYAPVVTVTPKLIRNTAPARDMSVVISSITTSKVSGYVSFNDSASGKATVGLNIIAVGIPAN